MRRSFPWQLYRRRALVESEFLSVKSKFSARAPDRYLHMRMRLALLPGLSFNLCPLRHRHLFLSMSTELNDLCPCAACRARELPPRGLIVARHTPKQIPQTVDLLFPSELDNVVGS